MSINNLSVEEKRKLLAQLLEKKAKKEQLFPLSFAQSRLWFLEHLQPGSSAYNIPAALKLTGVLDIPILEKSINKIVKRHEILRTIFIQVDGEPFQKVLPDLPLNIVQIDLEYLPPEQKATEIQKRIRQESLQIFNLEKPPLVRSKLLKLKEDEYILLFTMHHIIADYWSMRVLIQELATIYQSFLQKIPLSLAELPIQYPDYAVWQKEWLQKEARLTQLAYWEKKLGNNPPILQIPTDYPRPAIQTFHGATQVFSISPELSEKLTILSRKEGVTLFMTLLAAFKTLLYRYSGQKDILMGSTIANRNRPEIENLIGLFVNNLVFRTDLSNNPSFLTLLQQVKEVTLEAYSHQDLPFEYLVKELQLERQLSYNPLFQVMFILHNTPSKTVQLPNLTLSYLKPDNQTARFDLSLDMYETPSGLTGVFEYNTDLFKSGTIERLIGHFQTLLEGIVTHPEQKLSELPLLTKPEQKQLLIDWNKTDKGFDDSVCLHQLFERQVKQTPDQIAIIFENEQLTYQELNAKANQLAHYLRKRGVKPEVLVGICVERSLDMVVALLGILKAGGAYVPFDSTYPQERLEFMLEDSQISLFLTQKKLVNTLQKFKEKVIFIDTEWQIINQESINNLTNTKNSKNLAYVIYTSGSTGKPKGVSIPHNALVNFLLAMAQQFKLSIEDRLLSITTLSFDIAGLELYLPLIVGACTVIVSREVATDGRQLLEKVNNSRITIMQATPATWRLLLSAGWQGNQNLKILCGGEALDVQLGQQLVQKSKEVWNLYGPTETTIWSSVYRVEKSSVLLGRPIANTQFYVLDNHLNPLPVGMPGELYIAGAGLARGYFNRTDLTSEKFIANPFKPSSRLYKTGDLVRYHRDGNLEFLGRLDYQVKVRGFRIELGEIETILNQHPDVEKAIVIVQENKADDKRLVAYIVSSINKNVSDLSIFLANKLPRHMIPSSFIFLNAFPLTPNGKIDRHALPIQNQIDLEKAFVAPRTLTEETLTKIWTQALNLEQVSISDNFFELGGHSLLATKIIFQIRQQLNIELPLRCLFESPTIAELAQEIESVGKLNTTSLPPIQQISRTEKIPLSYAQQRQWFLAQLEPESPFYNIPTAIRLKGKLNIPILKKSFNEVVRRHEILRTAFHTVEGKPLAVISPETQLILPLIDLTKVPLSQQDIVVKKLAKEEGQHPFSLDNIPLIRVKLLRLAPQENIILLTMHHIISDAWSIGILVHEIAIIYQAFIEGKQSPLAELSIQYIDYAAWQQQWLQGKILETQLEYWRQQLKDAPTVLELPTDYQRPAIQTFRGATCKFQLSHELSQSLKTFSVQQGTTLFITLLAVFKTLLYRYTNSNDIVVGSPIAKRNSTEVEELIGFFVNTLVLRTDLSGNPQFAELLQRVKEVALSAYAHQDIPFEQLVEELQPKRDLSYSPLFQVMFVLQNAPLQPISLSDLSWSPIETESNIAKFDLSLYVSETVEGLKGTFEYNADLFSAAKIERMVGHFQNLIAEVITNPQQKLSNFNLLTEIEKQQILFDWNQTQHNYIEIKGFYQQFELQVQQTPDAIAVIFEQQHLTYRELNARANQLAHYLQKLGIKPDVLVVIYLERSLDMVVGLLGILKAGGAYVPLDPTYPPERLSVIIQDAQFSLLLTQQKWVTQLPKNTAQVICLDTDWNIITQEKTSNPISLVESDHLAYVIYTSGSTGIPKGVAITHHSVIALIDWAKTIFTREELSGVVAGTSICFDLSVFELFVPLSCGGTVILIENILQLPTLNSAPTLINTVPSAALELLRIHGIADSVLTVNLAGEALSNQLVQQLYQQKTIQRVFNLYGPSEDTTYSTFFLTQKGVTQSPSIGRPIPNTQAYILDSYLNLVPIGVPGELYLSGEGLARGYYHQPDLTAEKFIPNPFNPSQRLYKTGDLAQYLPDGTIEYLGRLDYQVKIRGFRIELGEIEAVLSQHPAITQAIVNPWEDDLNNNRLVAYIVSSTNLTPQNLRHFLKQKLPEYMIPSLFVTLEAFPLTPNGKIDRKALPEPELNNTQINSFVKSQTQVEKQLAQIWSQLLGIEQIGIYDNFFELGGDSILAIQAIAKAQQIGLKLTPKYLFQHQTIAELATVIGTNSPIRSAQELITGFVDLTPIQYWFFEQNLTDSHHWNQSILLEVLQPLNPILLEQVVQKLLKHHDGLRLRFEPTEQGWQAFIGNPSHFEVFTYIDLSELPDTKINSAILQTANQLQASFNLSLEPLIKVALLHLGKNKTNRLLIIIHHLIIDGVSWRILLDDIQNAYHQLMEKSMIQLPPKTTSIKDWIGCLKKSVDSTLFQSDIEDWLKIVGDRGQEPEVRNKNLVTSIPVDYQNGQNIMAEAQTVSVALNSQETQALLQELPIAYHTQINDVLLTALAKSFEQWTGEHQLLIELEGHGRENLFDEIDLSRTVGWFTTLFPLLLNWENTNTLEDTLKSIKEQLRNIPKRGMSYGGLRYLGSKSVQDKLKNLPKPQIRFNYLGQSDQLFSQSSLFVPAHESTGIARSPKTQRNILIEINAIVSRGQLQLNWSYSQSIHNQTTIEFLAQNFITILRQLINQCLSSKTTGHTPSDFPQMNFTQSELDDLLSEL